VGDASHAASKDEGDSLVHAALRNARDRKHGKEVAHSTETFLRKRRDLCVRDDLTRTILRTGPFRIEC
jgi:hypothetical protein